MSHTLLAADRNHLWRPYTSSEDHENRDPLIVERAEGPWLIDPSGRRYLDGSGSWWCNNLGHGHPRLREAMIRQAEKMMHCALADITHEPAVLLASKLVEATPPSLKRVFYSDNGSTSVEVAMKIALQYWLQNGCPQRQRFIALPGAYHGDTIGTMSLGAVDAFTAKFRPLLFDSWHPPEPLNGDWTAVFDALVDEIEARSQEIAAVIIEPLVQGAAGMRMYPVDCVQRVRDATRQTDTLLICDEVFTGFGRTGRMWASEYADIEPDLLCTAKGLSGGTIPFAATLATERIYDGFRGDKQRALMHGHTFCGNPLGAAVALEVLKIYEEDHIVERSMAKAERLADGFQDLQTLPGVTGVRALGMCAAFEIGDAGYHGKMGSQVQQRALERGAHLRPLGNTIYVTPPLNIPDTALDELIMVVKQAATEALQS